MGLLRPWTVTMMGTWFLVSAWVLSAGAERLAHWNFALAGAAVLLAGGWATLAYPDVVRWREGVAAALLAWLAASPWVLGYAAHTLDARVTLIAGVLGAVAALSVALWPPRSDDVDEVGEGGREGVPVAWYPGAALPGRAWMAPEPGGGRTSQGEDSDSMLLGESGHTVRVPRPVRHGG